MIEFLLYASMSCEDATKMIGRVQKITYMSRDQVEEVIEVIRDTTPECLWDENDWRNGA